MCPYLLLSNLLIITKDVCVQSHDGNLPSECLAGDLSIVQHQWAMAKWELCDTSHLTCRPLRKNQYVCVQVKLWWWKLEKRLALWDNRHPATICSLSLTACLTVHYLTLYSVSVVDIGVHILLIKCNKDMLQNK